MRGVTEAPSRDPESLDMPSTTLRHPALLSRVPGPLERAARLALLLAIALLGPTGEALAAPEHHLVYFRPSPSLDTAGYVMHLGTTSGDYTQHVDLGQPNAVNDVILYSTNIDTAVDLYVALSSYNQAGTSSGYSNEFRLAAAVPDPAPTPDPVPDPVPEPEPEPTRDPMPDPVVDPGYGTTLPPSFAALAVGITSDTSGQISLVLGDGSTTVLTVDSLAAARDLRPTRCDLDGDDDSDLVIGFGPGSNGQVALVYFEDGSVDGIESLVVGDTSYHAADGQTYPACGDIDGDGRNELVVGMGPAADAKLAVFDSIETRFAPFAVGEGGMITAPTTGTMNNAGTGCVPALGDIDGDQRDELVVGYTAPGHRSIAVLDDGLRGFARHESITSGSGLVRVARRNEDDGRGGGTYPALGDWDGDGLAEFAIGYGTDSGGWMLFLDDAANARVDTYPDFLRIQAGREDTQTSSGAVRPAFGDIDGDGRDELVVSFGLMGSHEIQVFEDFYTGSTNLFRGGAGIVDAGDEDVRWVAAPVR